MIDGLTPGSCCLQLIVINIICSVFLYLEISTEKLYLQKLIQGMCSCAKLVD